MAFVGGGVAERVVWAGLDAVFPVETGGSVGCAAMIEVMVSVRVGMERGGMDLQGEHPGHVRISLPFAIPTVVHGSVVGCSAEGIL